MSDADASAAAADAAPDMPMPPGPGKEHERLAPFAGTFRCVCRLWMDPSAAPMEEMTGTMVNTMVHGGRFLEQRFEGDPMAPGVPAFGGSGYWGYDTARGQWQGVWCDTASNTIDAQTGVEDEEGRRWTMSSSIIHPATGDEMPKRDVIELIDRDHHRMITWFGPEGHAVKTMELEFERTA